MGRCWDKIFVDHGLNETQQQFLGLAILHFGIGVYTICYGMFYLLLNHYAIYQAYLNEYVSMSDFLPCLFVFVGLWSMMMGGIAISATRKNPSLCPLQAGRALTIISFKMAVAVAVVAGIEMNSTGGSHGTLMATNAVLAITPPVVHKILAILVITYQIIEACLVIFQAFKVSSLVVMIRTRTTYAALIARPVTISDQNSPNSTEAVLAALPPVPTSIGPRANWRRPAHQIHRPAQVIPGQNVRCVSTSRTWVLA